MTLRGARRAVGRNATGAPDLTERRGFGGIAAERQRAPATTDLTPALFNQAFMVWLARRNRSLLGNRDRDPCALLVAFHQKRGEGALVRAGRLKNAQRLVGIGHRLLLHLQNNVALLDAAVGR